MKLTVKFEEHSRPDSWSESEEWHPYICYFEDDELKGMVETGQTKEQAFDELMITLRVKILYDNQLTF